MGSRASLSSLTRSLPALLALCLAVPSLAHCGAGETPYVVPELPAPRSIPTHARSVPTVPPSPVEPPLSPVASPTVAPLTAADTSPTAIPPAVPADATEVPSPGAASDPAPATDVAPAPPVHCASAPRLLPDGAVPPAPPHAPLGQDIDIPGDRPAYILPGNVGDPRVIVYLHGMCGDVTAPDYFREAVRARGTLIAVRGDTACHTGRFKWRDDASKIQTRIRAAFKHVNAALGGGLSLDTALLFGYSQGAERAERVAALYPKQYPRLVLGGPPTKASPQRLARAQRVAILGGELETTETMRMGHAALLTAGIASRFFTLDCAYHGYFGERAESQLTDVLDWVTAP
jgi:predicted esterase